MTFSILKQINVVQIVKSNIEIVYPSKNHCQSRHTPLLTMISRSEIFNFFYICVGVCKMHVPMVSFIVTPPYLGAMILTNLNQQMLYIGSFFERILKYCT
jgi:hypothetical protein